MNLEEFDSMLDGAKQPERKTYETIQPGTYTVEIIGEQTKPNRAGTGEYLELVLRVDGGKFGGNRIWDRLNLRNPSDKAVNIALATLKSIKQACGIDKLAASSDLVGHKLKVKTRLGEFNGKPTCEVVEYMSITGAGPQVVNPEPGREFGNDDYPF
jgi:hypothetical protein